MADKQMTEKLSQTQQEADAPRKGLLDDLSMSQVVATALAAVTSVALSSQIGIAGSIIGVAIASVVSTVASQIYKGMLLRSADKLRELKDQMGNSDATMVDPAARHAATGSAAGNPYATADLRGEGARTTGKDARMAGEHARIAPASLREEAAERRQAVLRRRVAIAAAVTGLVAVAITAGVIMLATNGEGIGTKVGAAPDATTQVVTDTKATTSEAATSHASTGTHAQTVGQAVTPEESGSAAVSPTTGTQSEATGSGQATTGSGSSSSEATTSGSASTSSSAGNSQGSSAGSSSNSSAQGSGSSSSASTNPSPQTTTPTN